MSDASERIYFIAWHAFLLLIFLVVIVLVIVSTGRRVSELRRVAAAYNARLPFAYYSSGSWILWVFQYLVLIVWAIRSWPNDISFSTALWIEVVQNAFWAVAIFSLYSKRFSRFSLILPSLIVFSILIALVDYRTQLLASEPFTILGAVLCATLFTALALSILQLPLSRVFFAVFVIHGLSQWVWLNLLFSPSLTPQTRLAILLFLPVWRMALVLSWMKVTPKLLQIEQPSNEESLGGSPSHRINLLGETSSSDEGSAGRSTSTKNVQTLMGRFKESVLGKNYADTQVELTPFTVMISSTTADLEPERAAAANAIKALHLHSMRAETLGSFPDTPRSVCESMARQCDIFILIIGERYGHVPEPEGISVVQLEYEVARAQNPKKILIYVKKGVTREPRLQEFLDRLELFGAGHHRTLFSTPKELYRRIRLDVQQWLTSRAKQKKKNER